MPRLTKVSRLAEIPGIQNNRMQIGTEEIYDPDILHLEKVETDLPPPKICIEATCNAINAKENNSYLPVMGKDSLRKLAVDRVSRISRQDYDWKSESIITAGSMSAIFDCLLALIEQGDEVIVTDPTYSGLISRIRIAGGTPIFVPLIPSPSGWSLDIKALENAASPKTKMLLISPGMPCGNVFTLNEWEAITRISIQTDSWLLYDASFEAIVYDQRTVIHPASFPNMRERTITVGTVSFELRMLGWRTGWIVGPANILNDIGFISMSNTICQPGISVAGVIAGLNAGNDAILNSLKILQERRDVLLHELDGLPIIPPHGAWSMLMDAETIGMTSSVVTEKLLKIAKIASTPMIGWGNHAANYVRFVFSNEPKERLLGIGKKVRKALEL